MQHDLQLLLLDPVHAGEIREAIERQIRIVVQKAAHVEDPGGIDHHERVERLRLEGQHGLPEPGL